LLAVQLYESKHKSQCADVTHGVNIGSDMHVKTAGYAASSSHHALRLLAMLLFVATPLTHSQSANTYDGKSALQCGANVNCTSQADVVAKMKTRWVVYSSKTNYNDPCFQAINRVQRIHSQVWNAGMAQQQMEVCNMQ
jgi:hypothetical protein